MVKHSCGSTMVSNRWGLMCKDCYKQYYSHETAWMTRIPWADGHEGMVETGPGWFGPIEEALNELYQYPVVINQVKSKFGELRLYFELDFHDQTWDNDLYDDVYDICRRIVRKAEEACHLLCSMCGDERHTGECQKPVDTDTSFN